MILLLYFKANSLIFPLFLIFSNSSFVKVIVKYVDEEGNEYVFVNEILPDESDVTDKYKIMVVHYEDGTLEKVSDPNLLQVLAPKFQTLMEDFE